MTYRPLPNGLYIGVSSIEGQGLYTDRALTKGCQLGESHYRIATNDNPSKHAEENKTTLIRTPLGGFYNHSMSPNTKKTQEGHKWFLDVIEDIKIGDEILVTYTLYKVEDINKLSIISQFMQED